MMAQQQLLKLKREEMLKKQQAAFGPRPEGSIPSRQVVFAQMMQVGLIYIRIQRFDCVYRFDCASG